MEHVCGRNLSEENLQVTVQPLYVAQHVGNLPLNVAHFLLALACVQDHDVHLVPDRIKQKEINKHRRRRNWRISPNKTTFRKQSFICKKTQKKLGTFLQNYIYRKIN